MITIMRTMERGTTAAMMVVAILDVSMEPIKVVILDGGVPWEVVILDCGVPWEVIEVSFDDISSDGIAGGGDIGGVENGDDVRMIFGGQVEPLA